MRQFIKISGLFAIVCSPLCVNYPVNAKAPSPARQKQLLNMLKHDCGSCHGLKFKGGLGPALLAQDLQHKPVDYLVQIIQQGKAGTAMPPWADFLSITESYWLINTLLHPPKKK